MLSVGMGLLVLLVPFPGFADTVFIYSSVNNLYGINLTSGQQTFLTSASLSPAVNALAANSENGLIYYGDGTSIYYWDPALGLGGNSHALINNFENGFFQAPIHNINSTGGSFLNGKYYVGSETDNGFIEDIHELTMSADGRQMVDMRPLDILNACNCSQVQLGGFGDIAVVEEGGGPVIYGSSADLTNNGQGTHAGIWRFELNTNSWKRLGEGNGGQVANSLDSRVYTNVGNNIRELNVSTGEISSQTLMNTNNAIWDFSGSYSYDFGDAPDSYGGASHLVAGAASSVFLGQMPPDNEPYSLHADASGVDGRGDDQTGVDDEDALSSLNDLNVGDSEYQLSLSCTGGFAAAWIDFNLNGKFDFDERNSNYPAQCQSQNTVLTWSGFDIADAGNSFVRIRVAAESADIYKPTGYVETGEVEDYEVNFKSLTSVSGNCPAGSTSHIYKSADVPKSYSGTSNNPTRSVIDIPDSLIITDVNVLDLQATHDSQRRLYFLLNHGGQQTYLYGNTCVRNTSFNMGFDDEAASGASCPPGNSESYRPFRVLSAYDGTDAQGEWQMRVYNFQSTNSGRLNNWALEICALSMEVPISDIRIGKVVEVVGRTVTVTLLVKNTGNTSMSSVRVVDNLDSVFGAGNYQISAAPQLLSAPAGFSADADYTGQSDANLLLPGNGVLQPDDEIKLIFSVDVEYGASLVNETYLNQAIVNAVSGQGAKIQDLSGTGLDLSVDYDDPTTITMNSLLEVSGVVFVDTSPNEQTSHDGIQQAQEVGVAGRAVRIIDVATGVEIATAISAADGSWTASLEPAYIGQPVEIVVIPTSTTQFISESPVSGNAVVTDGRVSLIVQAVSSENRVLVGLVKRPSLVLDQTANVGPGESVNYFHRYTATTHGTVEFSIETINSTQSNTWSETVFHDMDCNQVVDGSDYAVNASMPVSFNEVVCIVLSVDVPGNSIAGEFQQLKLTSTMYPSDSVSAGHGVVFSNTNTDMSNVITDSAGNLVLKKSVNNITLGGQPVTNNTALPGHVLEYTIAYINSGAGQISDLVINDEAPAFTSVDPGSAECSQTPQALICSPAVSGNQINWSFQGALIAGAGGQVSYRITVD